MATPYRRKTSAELKAEALAEMQAQGFPFTELKTNTAKKWQRDRKQPAFCYTADEGVSAKGNPWLVVTAWDYRETGGENKATFIYNSNDRLGSQLDDQERAQIQRDMQQRQQQREQQAAEQRQQGQQAATKRWEAAKPVATDYPHPALERREAQAHGLRLDADGKTLLSDARDILGNLIGLEEMYHQEHPQKGWKATMPHTSLSGGFHTIGAASKMVYLCEGYSTADAIHRATGQRVIVCFYAHNLPKVAQAYKLANPSLTFVVAGDDDRHNPKNTGREKATQAAEAIKARLVFPVFKDMTGNPTDFNDLMRRQGLDEVKRQLEARSGGPLKAPSLEEFLSMELPPRVNLIEPWLPTQGLAMIYAKTGVGKTHVSLTIAYQLTIGGNVFDWQIENPTSVLYIDGEMPANAMQERLASIALAAGEKPKAKFSILTQDLIEGSMPDIGQLEGQQELNDLISQHQVIVIDNISTLNRTSSENKADDWVLMQEWVLGLRAKGKSVILVHHAGKNGDQRGTSKRNDVLDTVIELKRPADYEHYQGARFEIHFQKARGCMGEAVRPVEVQLEQDENGGASWSCKTVEESLFHKVVESFNDGLKQHEIAQELETTRGTVSKYLKKARAQGLISADGGAK